MWLLHVVAEVAFLLGETLFRAQRPKSKGKVSLANKAPRSHKAMLISQGFNPETGDLETFMEQCEQAETTDNISRAKFAASDEDSDTKRKKKRLKSKGQDKQGKKRKKQHSKMYFSLHGENTSHTTR